MGLGNRDPWLAVPQSMNVFGPLLVARPLKYHEPHNRIVQLESCLHRYGWLSFPQCHSGVSGLCRLRDSKLAGFLRRSGASRSVRPYRTIWVGEAGIRPHPLCTPPVARRTQEVKFRDNQENGGGPVAIVLVNGCFEDIQIMY